MRKRGFVRSLPWVAAAALAVAGTATVQRFSEPPRPLSPEALSRHLLRERIAKDLPRMAGSALDEVIQLTLLRQWAYENTDWSTPGANLDDDPANGFYEMDAPELFSAFRKDRGGVLCGGTAYAFMRLCRLYGYDALTLDFGAPGVSTHVVTLVRLSLGGRDVWSVQDPTYDATHVHRDGSPFDYLDLLRALRDGRAGEVFVEQGQGRSREYIVAPGDAGSMLSMPGEDESLERTVGRPPDGAMKYRRRYSIDQSEVIDGSPTGEFLARDGRPEEAIYLYLYPIGISGGSAFDRVQHRVPRRARPRYMMKRAREILGLEGERP
jgi:hypothetical protein